MNKTDKAQEIIDEMKTIFYKRTSLQSMGSPEACFKYENLLKQLEKELSKPPEPCLRSKICPVNNVGECCGEDSKMLEYLISCTLVDTGRVKDIKEGKEFILETKSGIEVKI